MTCRAASASPRARAEAAGQEQQGRPGTHLGVVERNALLGHDASDHPSAMQVYGKNIRAIGKYVEHAEAEVVRVAPVEDDAPAPVGRSVTGRVRSIQKDRAALDVTMQHKTSGRVKRIGEISAARWRRAAENEFAFFRRSFVSPAHRHAVSGDDERTVGDVGGCLWHEPEAIGTREATVVRWRNHAGIVAWSRELGKVRGTFGVGQARCSASSRATDIVSRPAPSAIW